MKPFVAILAILLLIGACAPSRRINGTGFGGTDQVLSAIHAAVERVDQGLLRYAQNDHPEYLCDRRFSGPTAFLQAHLLRVARDEDLRAQAVAHLSGSSLRQALGRAIFRTTSNPAEVTLDGVIKDALTRSTDVAVYRPHAIEKHVDELAALAAHEAGHVEGYGPDAEDLLDASAACVVAYLNGLEWEGEPPPESGPLFLDDFSVSYTAPSLGPNWNRMFGAMTISGGMAVGHPTDQSSYQASGVYLTDLRIRSRIDLYDAPEGKWLHVFARRVDGNNLYAAYFNRNASALQATIWMKKNGSWTQLATTAVPGSLPTNARGEMAFEVKGNRLKLDYQGSEILNVTNGELSGPGRIGMQTIGGSFEDFLIESP